MGKMIQADTFHGQTMFLNWRGYHSSTSNGVLWGSGWSTNLTYPYATIIPPFKGCINKVNITNNPYSSYQSGPTGSSATLRILVNGSAEGAEAVSYTFNKLILTLLGRKAGITATKYIFLVALAANLLIHLGLYGRLFPRFE